MDGNAGCSPCEKISNMYEKLSRSHEKISSPHKNIIKTKEYYNGKRRSHHIKMTILDDIRLSKNQLVCSYCSVFTN